MLSVNNSKTDNCGCGGSSEPPEPGPDPDPVEAGPVAYSILSNDVVVLNTNWVTIGHVPWLQSRHGSYTTGLAIIRTTYVDRELDVRIYNETAASTIGSLIAINSSNTLSFPLILPVANANMELQVRKSAIGGISPHILGCTLEFEE